MDIVMTGFAGLAESAALAQRRAEELKKRLPERFFRAFARFLAERKEPEIPPEAKCLTPIGQGGVWEALWRLADSAENELGLKPAGLAVRQSAVPVRQEIIEICELLELDPYRIPSGGWLFVMENGRDGAGTVIGRLLHTKARTVEGMAGLRYLEKPGREEASRRQAGEEEADSPQEESEDA